MIQQSDLLLEELQSYLGGEVSFMAKKYDVNLAVLKRWLRTLLPQVPGLLLYVAQVNDVVNLPSWVLPASVLVGTLATAVDKFLREVGFYDETLEKLGFK